MVFQSYKDQNTDITWTKGGQDFHKCVKESIQRSLECQVMEEIRVGNKRSRNYGKNMSYW